MLEELKQKLKEKTDELKSVKAENKDQLEAINKLLQEHEENINKVIFDILLVLRLTIKKCHCFIEKSFFLPSWKRNMNRNVRMKLKHYRKQWKRKKVK